MSSGMNVFLAIELATVSLQESQLGNEQSMAETTANMAQVLQALYQEANAQLDSIVEEIMKIDPTCRQKVGFPDVR